MAGNKNSGRRQQPEQLARLKGTLQPSRRNPVTGFQGAKKITTILTCCHLVGYETLNERSKKIYLSACRQVMAFGLLQQSDLPELLVYAKEFDNYLSCCADIEENGRYKLKYDDEGNVSGTIDNPSNFQKKVSWDIIKNVSANFGFSPYDRQRLRAEVDPEDPTTKIVNIIMNGGDNGPEDQ